MKIALINLFTGHTEVFGYLIEQYKKYNHEITYFYKDDSKNDFYGYIDYFEELYGIIERKNINDLELTYMNFNIIIFITMTVDVPEYIKNHKNTYGIIHNATRKSPYINNYIALYPNQMESFKKIIKNKKISYTYPFYNTPHISNKEYKYILYIGNVLDNDDDILNFQNNIKYELIYFNNKNKKINNKSMKDLVKYLDNTIFILGKKTYIYNDCYSGSITLSYSFNIPIILQKNKLIEYGIDGISFDSNYSELIDYINNIDFNDYNILLNKMNEFKKIEINKNTEYLLNL